MSKLIMIRDAGTAEGTYKTVIWNGPLNNKARHHINKLMKDYFEDLYRKMLFIDRLDLVATIFDESANVMPVYLTYGGIIADDQWQMYAGCYWGYPHMARWTRELSRDEMKIYLNSKYGRRACYFDTDTVRGGDPD